MSARKSEGMKDPHKKPGLGGGSKGKTAKGKVDPRKTATGKDAQAGAEIEMRKTRTKAARQKTRRLEIEPLITSEEIEDQEYSPEEFQQMQSAVLDGDGGEALRLIKKFVKRLKEQKNQGMKSHLG